MQLKQITSVVVKQEGMRVQDIFIFALSEEGQLYFYKAESGNPLLGHWKQIKNPQ